MKTITNIALWFLICGSLYWLGLLCFVLLMEAEMAKYAMIPLFICGVFYGYLGAMLKENKK